MKKQPVLKSRRKPKSGFRYNCRFDLPDQRDFLFAQRIEAPEELPRLVDLRLHCSPVVNQGRIGSCTGNALAGALDFLEIRGLSTPIKTDDTQVFNHNKFEPYSRLFIYYNERLIEGRVDQDSGATLRDGIKSLLNFGGCRESLWKYTNSNVFKKPSTSSYKEASNHKISVYMRIQSLQEMRQCLSAGFPFAFGMTVYESFESAEVARTGLVPLPAITERMLGGHAVLCVGYNDIRGCLIIRNSWGTAWGQKGYFMLPYEYAENLKLVMDFWTIRR